MPIQQKDQTIDSAGLCFGAGTTSLDAFPGFETWRVFVKMGIGQTNSRLLQATGNGTMAWSPQWRMVGFSPIAIEDG
jgi:hypothetical protein